MRPAQLFKISTFVYFNTGLPLTRPHYLSNFGFYYCRQNVIHTYAHFHHIGKQNHTYALSHSLLNQRAGMFTFWVKNVWTKGQFQLQTSLAVSYARTRKQISNCRSQFPWKRSFLICLSLTLHLSLSLILQVWRWEGIHTLPSNRGSFGPRLSCHEPIRAKLSSWVWVL